MEISRILFFKTFPLGFVGKLSTTFIYLGTLKWAIFPLQNSLTSSIVRLVPDFNLNQAHTSSPTRGSGTPITFASTTLGCVRRKDSTSAGYILAPLNDLK